MRLILVRHGETDLHLAGLMQGNNGAPLNATGRSQARAIAEAITRLEVPRDGVSALVSLNETGHLRSVAEAGNDAGA